MPQVFSKGTIVQEYKLTNQLGKGSFGIVFEAQGPEGLVAIKTSEELYNNTYFEEELNVLLPMRTAKHVVNMLDAFHHRKHLVIVMEIMSGTLKDLATFYPNGLPLRMINHIGLDITSGLAELNRAGFIHCDIKPANVLFKGSLQRPVIKIGDLGLACGFPTFSQDGTWTYMPREALEGKPSTEPRDTWPTGLILVYLRTKTHPLGRDLPKTKPGLACRIRRRFGRETLKQDYLRMLEQVFVGHARYLWSIDYYSSNLPAQASSDSPA